MEAKQFPLAIKKKAFHMPALSLQTHRRLSFLRHQAGRADLILMALLRVTSPLFFKIKAPGLRFDFTFF